MKKVAVLEAETGQRSNIDILKELAYQESLSPRVSLETDPHTLRVKRALGMRVATSGGPKRMNQAVAKKLAEADLVWKVDRSFVMGIKYAAAIKGLELVRYVKSGRWHGQAFKYVGDIPEFALDNMDAAVKAGVRHFTVHSSQPLPVKKTSISLPRTDPVLIGWTENPDIRVAKDGTIRRMSRNVEGVVVAVWDGDREEILG